MLLLWIQLLRDTAYDISTLIANVTGRAQLLYLPLLVTGTTFGNIIEQNNLTVSVAMSASAAVILISFYSYLLQS